jgi:DNA-binding transcriptional regulator YhcF (GntR family)
MKAKEQAQAVIDNLKQKGYSETEIAEGVIEYLKELNK